MSLAELKNAVAELSPDERLELAALELPELLAGPELLALLQDRLELLVIKRRL